jgi:hypothetical protein
MVTLAEIVDPTAVWQTIVVALVTGIGVTTVFSIGIFAIARFVDLGRDERPVGAFTFAALAMLALLSCAAAVVVGVIVMTSK